LEPEVKRFAITFFGAMIGFFSTWVMSGLAASIDWPLKPYRGCYEIDVCSNVPWWGIVNFILWTIGPAVGYAGIAFIGSRQHWKLKQWVMVSIAALLLTAVLYFSWFIYRSYF
jgi:hypothetical protein